MITSTSVKTKYFERKLLIAMRYAMSIGGWTVISKKLEPLFTLRYRKGRFTLVSHCGTSSEKIIRALLRAKPFQAVRHRIVAECC